MAYRLGEYVVFGELYNTRHYTTHGWILLRGESPGRNTTLYLNLTGDCDLDLKGKHFRFQSEETLMEGPVFRAEEHPKLQLRQIGPTGTFTAEGWVRAMPCSVEEYVRRAALGEPPPTTWQRHLYLEWSGQNGRVVIELAGVVVEECIHESMKDEPPLWVPVPNNAQHPDMTESCPTCGPEITVISLEGDTAQVDHWIPVAPDDEDEEDNDSLPDELRQALKADAASIDRAIRDGVEDENDEDPCDVELIDYCIEHSEEKPVTSFFGDLAQLPDPDQLDDGEVEAQLKSVLGRLAMLGVTVDLCDHFTPRGCLRLLKERILRDAGVFEELIGTNWVTHIMTSEYCAQCTAELDAEMGGEPDAAP